MIHINSTSCANSNLQSTFASSRPGELDIIDRTLNSNYYNEILQRNVNVAVHDLKLKRGCVMQQDNNSKHMSKSTTGWWKKEEKHCFRKAKSES